jgi:hypothetical protein
LSSQPEEDEPDENTKANEFSQSGQSNSCSDHRTPAIVEPQVAAHRKQEKVKEGSRLVRKLKQFRKGKHFVLVYTVCIQTLYRAFSWKCSDCDNLTIDYSVTIEVTVQGFPMHWMLTFFV